MAKILRNDTGSAINISDTGITVDPGAGNQYAKRRTEAVPF